MRARMFLAHLAILAFLTQTATAAVWVFGDSNVDTGWFKIAPFSGDTNFDALLADPTLNVGKPTNNPGAMAVEVLATLLQTTAIPANQGGTNFATSGAKNFNKNDDDALDHYMKGAVYAWADINSVREDIKADQMAGGTKFNILHIDNIQNTACLKPDINTYPNLQTAWALICSANSTVSPLNPNVNVQQTLFADDQHWATGAQKVLASYYYCLIKTTWPQLVPQTIPLPHEPKVPPIPCDAFSAIPQPRPPPLR